MKPKLTMDQKLKYAEALGEQAYNDKKPRIPSKSVELHLLMNSVPIGHGAAQLMMAWIKGWDSRNLSEVKYLERNQILHADFNKILMIAVHDNKGFIGSSKDAYKRHGLYSFLEEIGYATATESKGITSWYVSDMGKQYIKSLEYTLSLKRRIKDGK